MMTPHCIACAAVMQIRYRDMYDDRYGHPGLFDIYGCPSCGQAQTTPLLKDEDLSSLYGTYYPRRVIDVDALVKQVGTPAASEAVCRRRREGTDNQGQYLARLGMTVLDYGCGAGASLMEAAALGADAYGIEADPNVKQVVDALGLRIHIGTLDDFPHKDLKFDLIVLNQVLEHIPDPTGLLARLAEMLKPEGKLVLAVPNVGSVFARFFKQAWINWHIPYHLHHFNPDSIRLFLEHCGWRVVSARTITPNLWTVLQCRAAVETTTSGRPNPMWTGEPVSEGTPSPGKPSWLLGRLHKFALTASHPKRYAALTFFNRTIDRMGWGDSLLVEAVPASRPRS
jgi:SAM-dependent methyltransferase